MASILFINHDVVGARMAGPGIRAFELARVLVGEHAVTLATPRPADALPPGVAGYTYQTGDAASLAPALDAAELIVANGFVLEAHPEIADRPAPLVLDMYDPTALENLALLREHDPAARAERGRRDVALLAGQLRVGDCLLCATERQRDLYLGALLAVGRVGAELADTDPALRGLLRVVPFGLPTEPPPPAAPPWDGLDPDALVILWSGGLWDWMDPLTLVRAMPQVLAAIPRVRLVFLAGAHPGNAHPMRMPGRARNLAHELGLLGREVLFVERWVPYAERSGALLNAAVAVYLHHESLESSYAAVRSRFLDHLWAGLPSVVSAGDAAAALVAARNLGRVVAPGDVEATAAALIALLSDDEQRRGCAERARAVAAEYTWERVAAPLLEFCRHPRRAPDRPLRPAEPPAPPPEAEDDQSEALAEVAQRDARAREQDAARNTALAASAANWQVREPPLPGGLVGRIRRLLVEQIVRPFIVPLIEQQNGHNAAVARALDALAENADARRSDLYATLDQQEDRAYARIRELHDGLAALGHELIKAQIRLAQAEGRLAELENRQADVDGRLTDLDDADTNFAARLAGLAPSRQPEEWP